MTPRELAQRLAVISVILDRAKELKEELRIELREALDQVGADSAAAQLPDGTRVAKVGIVAPKPRAQVIDEDRFTKHVGTERPDEIVARIRESYRKYYLDSLEATSDGEAVNPQTGEIVPGVRFAQTAPYPSLRFEKEGREQIIAAIHTGEIKLDLAITEVKEIER